jgi:hypothetical protein
MNELEIYIAGSVVEGADIHLENIFSGVSGISRISIDDSKISVKILIDSEKISITHLREIMLQAGYKTLDQASIMNLSYL